MSAFTPMYLNEHLAIDSCGNVSEESSRIISAWLEVRMLPREVELVLE